MNKLNLLIIGYNRVDYLTRLMNSVPFSLLDNVLISVDGPKNNIADKQRVAKVHKLVLHLSNKFNNIEIYFNKENLGCGLHVQSSLNLFFEKNCYGAILEDDCIPSLSFFNFMSYALKKFQNNHDILTVSGSNLFSNNFKRHNNIIYSNYPHSWGWGTWNNRLIDYDPLLSTSNRLSDKDYLEKIFNSRATNYWISKFSKVRAGEIDTWDYQLVHLGLQKGLKNIVPPKNLVTNIGFGIRATHTKNFFSRFSRLEKSDIVLPIQDESIDILNREYDNLYEKLVCRL